MIRSIMLEPHFNLGLVSFGAAAFAYVAFLGAYVWRTRHSLRVGGRAGQVFLAAMLAGAVWAIAGLVSELSTASVTWQASVVPWLDWLRYALLLCFVLFLLRVPEAARPADKVRRLLLWGTGAVLTVVLLLNLGREFSDLRAVVWMRPLAYGWLALSVIGLLLVEQLLRNVDSEARWGVKPVCLGLGVVFAFDLYLFSQAALFQGIDPDALGVRPLIHSFAVPLLYLASRRRVDWLGKLHVSRAVVFHSATMLLAGLYLLLVSGVGYYIRYTGGDWGRAMQIALIAVALLTLLLALLSGSMRAKLRVYISKHFFSYRYDYREEWLRFTAMLSSQNSPQELGISAIRGLANLVESPSGVLWLRLGGAGDYQQSARWNLPEIHEPESADAKFAVYLQETGWIVNLDELRNEPQRHPGLVVPQWMRSDDRYWLLVPLPVGANLIGFAVLGRPRTPVDVNWEVRDLLRTASSQAASYLAQMMSTEALLEARKFDAFNRMSAFVVHDLKNIVTQLSLMMKNARRLRDNPEFQEDMLATVENSLEKMRQLMLQLREGSTPHGVSQGVDLVPIAKRLATGAHSKGRQLVVEIRTAVSTRGHEERIERVIGHVVQNAFDATPEDGRVWLTLDRHGSNACIEVGDTGCGMSDEFIRTRLFKPFQTTKPNGMGIGAFESFQYLQELGGKINVESEIGQGTKVTIHLPLFHAGQTSDLGMLSFK
ncbi:XrtA/PEP-CTERM system histidine kinase PrsK [Roseateles sp.]|jgi:putative PEP-CTERM system histidine kinase|uniref:XrtA/PEP-CTERM system histidine kinase PrsK n=1 Tax=Roseateles sp. TaxID=1971397 RepID=UPI0037CBD11F